MGGFYEYYYSITSKISVHKVHKNGYLLLCIFLFVSLYLFLLTIKFYKFYSDVHKDSGSEFSNGYSHPHPVA